MRHAVGESVIAHGDAPRAVDDARTVVCVAQHAPTTRRATRFRWSTMARAVGSLRRGLREEFQPPFSAGLLRLQQKRELLRFELIRAWWVTSRRLRRWKDWTQLLDHRERPRGKAGVYVAVIRFVRGATHKTAFRTGWHLNSLSTGRRDVAPWNKATRTRFIREWSVSTAKPLCCGGDDPHHRALGNTLCLSA